MEIAVKQSNVTKTLQLLRARLIIKPLCRANSIMPFRK
jgi:hypothetical protein